MGTDTSVGTDQLKGAFGLPRTADGAVDARELLMRIGRGAPAFIALWGLFWLTGRGIATERLDVGLAVATAIPLWVASHAWRLPWWLHAGAASFPLSIAIVALAHGDATGTVRGSKLAYGAILFLAIAAWARTARRRMIVGLLVAGLGAGAFVLSWSAWMTVQPRPWNLMKGTLDWHNQFAMEMIFGLAAGIFVAVLGRGVWSIFAALCAAICGAGVVLSGSRYGFALACGVVVAALAAALIVGLREKQRSPVVRWLLVIAGVVLLPLILRSPLFFPGTSAGLNPLGTMTQRGGFHSLGGARIDWWIAAWRIGADHPLTGTGLLTFADEAVCYDAVAQWHPHNEWAYAWAEGGIVGLLPMLLLVVGVVVLVVRSLRPMPDAPALRADPMRWGAVAATVAAVGHLVVEYDLYYTMLVGLMATVGGTAVAPVAALARRSSRALTVVAWTGVASAVVVVLLAIVGDPSFTTWPWPVAEGYSHSCIGSSRTT
ncbi:O-antigen ligase family protein [Microbacterium sp. B35-30]|uniref:O-antigen ligase family protein n=1 Tax=Microbacterium sp. B35-30 TaxID=1962642 RepID=UPI0013CFB50B|nr:O-antigen ligase family protein [Microbacterium sp. B35-30]KAF2416371.1 hypothetical protein B2K11_16350 [Microbacterium sp. B35-30]